jgi:hypothetical protein
MFGYIRPLECELKVREQAEYRAHYCGVCKAIGRRYGQPERLALSYECAFLAAFLTALTGGAGYSRGNCAPRCYRGKRPIANPSPAGAYAADVNVLLAWYQKADDALDEKRVSTAAVRAALRRAYRKAARRHPELDAKLSASMDYLHEIENKKIASTDEPSDAFGRFLSAVILHAPGVPETEEQACGWMFYNLGKWVYLADAWDDRAKDEKRGNYNPFLLNGMSAGDAEFLMNITLSETQKAFDLLTFTEPGGLIENVVRLGLSSTQRRVLGQECKAGKCATPQPAKERTDEPL